MAKNKKLTNEDIKKAVAIINSSEIQYRLHLTDSNNHSAFIDINVSDLEDTKECYTAVTPLLERYKETIYEHSQAQVDAVANDIQKAKELEATKKKQQKALKDVKVIDKVTNENGTQEIKPIIEEEIVPGTPIIRE